MKKYSLNRRIIILVFWVTSILILLITAFFISNHKRHELEAFKAGCIIKADLMSDNAVIPLAFYQDMSSVRDKLEKFRIYPSIEQCLIYNRQGEMLTGYRRDITQEWHQGELLEKNAEFKGQKLFVYEPINYRGDNYGTILLIEDTGDLYKEILNISILGGGVALFLILILAMVTLNLHKRISEPLQRLVETTDYVSRYGDYSQRLEKRTQDEIGSLYANFNKLMENLQISQSERNEIETQLKASLKELEESRASIFELMENLHAEMKEKIEAIAVLEETRQRFDLAVEGSNDGLWDWENLAKNDQWWSPRYYELLNENAHKTKSGRQEFISRLHPGDVEIEQQMMNDHLCRKSKYDIRLRIMKRNGEYNWFRVRGQALWNEAGKPYRMSGSIQDIQEQQNIKTQLNIHIQELEEISQYIMMINSCREPGEICRIIGKKAWELNPQSYVIISLWEPDEDKIIVQGAYGFEDKYQELERILGWDLRKFSIKPDINFGKNTIPEAREKKLILMKNGVYDLLGHTVSETVTRLVQRFLGVETVYHIGFGIADTFSGGLTILLAPGRQLMHKKLLETLMNYSSLLIERIYTYRKLIENRNQLELAVESGEIGMWDWDIENNDLQINDYWLEMLGYRKSDYEDIRNLWESLLHPQDKADTIEKLNDYLDGRSDKYESEFRLRTKSGDWKWVRARGRIVQRNTQRKALRLIGSHIDIDEFKRNQEKISQLNEVLEDRVKLRTAELEKSNKELEEFSYTVSHDLRAPIRAINGYAEILKEEHHDELSEDSQQLLAAILDNVRMMGHLIDDLLHYVRLSTLPIQKTELDLSLIAWNAYNHLPDSDGKKDTELIISDLDPAVGSQSLVKMLFTHLIENAVKYRHPEHRLEIVIGNVRRDGENYYYVKDNGIGFDMRYVHNIFKIFHRLHGMDEYEGTGVGLALCKRIVEMHGGNILAESEPGKGTVIYFNFGR